MLKPSTCTYRYLLFKRSEKRMVPAPAAIFVVICISLELVEDCSIAGYEEEYGDTRLPYGHKSQLLL
jgi:hypothetical protein